MKNIMENLIKESLNEEQKAKFKENSNEFFEDWSSFINDRLEYSFINLEKKSEFKKIDQKFIKLYRKLEKELPEETMDEIDKLIKYKGDMRYLYINDSYRAGFLDGVSLSTYVEN